MTDTSKAAAPADPIAAILGPEKPAPKGRRPQESDYEGLFLDVSEGKSLRQACIARGIDHSSTYKAIYANPGLERVYSAAKEMRGEEMAEKVVMIGLAAAAGRIPPDQARVAIDALKWRAGQMAPKRLGDKLTVDLNVGRYDHLSTDELEQLARLLGKAHGAPEGGEPGGSEPGPGGEEG